MTIKAEWIEATDKDICLCCGQTVARRGGDGCSPLQQAQRYALLDALGYTRENLLGKHRAQLDHQLPGLAEWLEGQ